MKSLFGICLSRLGKKSLLLLLSILISTFGISNSVLAADKIYASYSILEIPISVIKLEHFSNLGHTERKSSVMEDYISLQQLQKIYSILNRSIQISPSVAQQFMETEAGEFLLQKLATLITDKSDYTESTINHLRTAIITASEEPEGLTLLNVLRHHPSSSIYLNLANSFKVAIQLEDLISDTNQAVANIQQVAQIEAINSPTTSLSFLSDLPESGRFTFKRSQVKFFDATRSRSLVTDIYLPQTHSPAPVIVISHGLGLNSSNFDYLANNLASQGFAVVVPNHPSILISNHESSKLQTAREFIDRPLDIKYILDQLEIYNQTNSQFQGKLNLDKVGVVGQSFGAYTALALAGAKINFQELSANCLPNNLKETWNMSLLLQCRALELLPNSLIKNSEQEWFNLADDRVKSVIAINPVTSSVFGKSGLNNIQIPVMFISSSQDTVAPALYEQILPFSWLENPGKYLVMLVGASHFSTIGNTQPGTEQISLPPEMVGNASQARNYINNLTLPFFQTYVSEKREYLPFLNANYAENIADDSLGLSMVTSLDKTGVAPALDDYGKKTSYYYLEI